MASVTAGSIRGVEFLGASFSVFGGRAFRQKAEGRLSHLCRRAAD